MNALNINSSKKIASFSFLLAIISSGVYANEPWSQDRQWLFGDWGGTRSHLEEQGYKFNLSWMNQTATLIDGGKTDSHPTRNADQLTLGANFDLNKIANWENTTAAFTITKRGGDNIANDIGMKGSPTEIYGRGTIWRLTQAWIKTRFIDNALQVKIGRMGMAEDFNSSQCEFQSLILCGGQIGKAQGDVWYNGPVSGWAANVKYTIAPEWTIGAGIYANNPENTEEKKNLNFNLSTNEAKGTLIPVEIAWKTTRVNQLSGEYKLGGFLSTEDYQAVDGSGKQQPKSGLWLNAQQQLTSKVDSSRQGLYTAINLTFNNDTTASISSTQQIALWYKGALNSRPMDQIGFGLGRYRFNDKVASNSDRDDEVDAELNYTYNYSPAVMIRPNIQYVYQPYGLKSIDNAWVAGVSVKLNF